MQKTWRNLGTQQETKMEIVPNAPQVKGQCITYAPGLQFQSTATHLSTFKGVFSSMYSSFWYDEYLKHNHKTHKDPFHAKN